MRHSPLCDVTHFFIYTIFKKLSYNISRAIAAQASASARAW